VITVRAGLIYRLARNAKALENRQTPWGTPLFPANSAVGLAAVYARQFDVVASCGPPANPTTQSAVVVALAALIS